MAFASFFFFFFSSEIQFRREQRKQRESRWIEVYCTFTLLFFLSLKGGRVHREHLHRQRRCESNRSTRLLCFNHFSSQPPGVPLNVAPHSSEPRVRVNFNWVDIDRCNEKSCWCARHSTWCAPTTVRRWRTALFIPLFYPLLLNVQIMKAER